MVSNQPYFVTDTSATILPNFTTNQGTINVYQQPQPVQAVAAPSKRLSDREWLDAEVEEVCARAA